MKKQVDGNAACSKVAYLFSEICSIYPITPSSTMASNVDYLTNTGLKNIFNSKPKVIEMQSEAGAAGTMHGALLSGSLASTFTASQGLLLMIPNMHKMAGECLPGVIHVASRTIATHALSIFGDHSDVYSVRNTGFCMLSSSNVYDAQNLASVAHLSAIKGSLPFVHFFDGFRTSHELNTIEEIDFDKLKQLVPWDEVNNFKDRALNVGCGHQYGLAENEDIYFQSVEARNELYNKMPDIVNSYMESINEIMHTDYKPFNYYGSNNAENIIIAMGSVTDTIKLVVDEMNKNGSNMGLINVHLYRPFSVKYLLNVLPNTVKNIAVLDRTKEAGSIGEPLYLDIVSALKDKNINIVGGRYGLSSKNTTPRHIYSVYKMLEDNLQNNFIIGINDDVTNLSLPEYDFGVKLNAREIKIFGFGSDGMVSASKELLKIIAKDDYYVQGYFEYDSKKSGGVTVSNLRWSKNLINAPFYVNDPEIVVVTKEEYFHKFNVLKDIKENGILLINTSKKGKDLNEFLPNDIKNIIKNKNIKIYYIDASKIAIENNINGKINKIMEVIILKLLNIENGYSKVSELIKETFVTKGEDIINNNLNALTSSLDNLCILDNISNNTEQVKLKKNIFDKINARMGDELKVSELVPFRNGAFPWNLTKYEKRKTSYEVPLWDPAKCIECGQCNIVCPHGVIRPLILKEKVGKECMGNKENHYYLAISEYDCTGCGLCIKSCPTNALSFGEGNSENREIVEKYFDTYENPDIMNKYTMKGASLRNNKFKFHGACAGCGETSYIKLLTQLYGDELVIANATGCSSIYGGSAPATPYSIPWANSLFEDNAEFALGIHTSYKQKRERIKEIMTMSLDSVDVEVKTLFNEWLANSEDAKITTEIKNNLENKNIPKDLKDLISYIPSRVVWALGGDGWAYDIGFGGLDHVMSQNENVKCLILDTEVYSNTGGQASKSSKIGAVAEFADFGKKTYKKDLFRIAMSYPNCYVASISLGSNIMHTIKIFKEAMEHNGPAVIIAYSPCVEHGIKNGMSCALGAGKLAIDVGYQILMHYKPEDEKLYIDSKEPDFDRYQEFLDNEVRFKALKIKDKELADTLLSMQKENAVKRYNYYKKLI
ncbi:MAG: pyruvate:ferredoxin (flavodoxin) oxidoreductase [Firmicutes bacterium]|nr:pyruvate:ferredoxin (flavodoxin) oxidoreductase [Bacillota bacterium]